MSTDFDTLSKQLGQCLLRDRPALKKRLSGLRRRAQQGQPFDKGLAAVTDGIARSVELAEQRQAVLPVNPKAACSRNPLPERAGRNWKKSCTISRSS